MKAKKAKQAKPRKSVYNRKLTDAEKDFQREQRIRAATAKRSYQRLVTSTSTPPNFDETNHEQEENEQYSPTGYQFFFGKPGKPGS